MLMCYQIIASSLSSLTLESHKHSIDSEEIGIWKAPFPIKVPQNLVIYTTSTNKTDVRFESASVYMKRLVYSAIRYCKDSFPRLMLSRVYGSSRIYSLKFQRSYMKLQLVILFMYHFRGVKYT